LKSENLFEVFLAFYFHLLLLYYPSKTTSANFLRTSPLPYLRAAKVATFHSFPNYSKQKSSQIRNTLFFNNKKLPRRLPLAPFHT
jgi:hypothetical protein